MVKRALAIFSLFVALFGQIAPALGLSSSQQQLFQLGINYFDSSASTLDCSQASSDTGTGTLFGPQFPDVSDVNDLTTRINNYIANTYKGSPFEGLGAAFVTAGQQYNVNPAMLVGIADKEEGLGTRMDQYSNRVSHNSFGFGKIPDLSVDQYGFAVFDSFESSIGYIARELANNYLSQTGPYYSTTIREIMNHYTPPNPALATSRTLAVMHKVLDGIAETGNPDNLTAAFSPGTTSDSQCQNTNGYQSGANGYELKDMAHFYQCDPSWKDSSYGSTTLCKGGCGITSMTMVVDTLKGLNLKPDFMAEKYAKYYIDSPDPSQSGTSWGLWQAAANDYKLQYADIGADYAKAAATLRQGGLVIISVNNSGGNYFTTGSHLMILRAVDDQGNFYIANTIPYHEDQGYSPDFLNTHGFLGHMFAFNK